jgi:hypothetical protein
MMNASLPLTSAVRARRQAAAASRSSMYPHRFQRRAAGSAWARGKSSVYSLGPRMLENRRATNGIPDHWAIWVAMVSLATLDSA